MKHTKHILSLVLCLVMLLGVGLVPAYAGLTAGVPNQGRVFTYKKLSYEVYGTGRSKSLTCRGPAFYTTKDGTLKQHQIRDMVVPAKVSGIKVTRIDYDTSDSTAAARNAIRSLTIPESVTWLQGFKKCKNLKTIAGIKSIEYITFDTLASTAYKAAAVNKNRYGAFYVNDYLVSCNGKIKELVIKKGTTRIIPNALKNSKVESITFPNSLQTFAPNFNEFDYRNVSYVSPDMQNKKYSSLKEIKVARNNPFYTAKDGVLYNKDMTTLIWYPCCKDDRTFTVPSTVKKLAPYCFYGNYSLYHIKLNESLEWISDGAFVRDRNLKSIRIPANVEWAAGGFDYTNLNLPIIAEKGSLAEIQLKNKSYSTEDEDDVRFKVSNPCETHSYQTVKGVTPTACRYGYSDYQQCTVCGMVEGFTQLAKTELSKKAVTLAGGKGSFTIKMDAVKGATGFDVCYTKDGKTTLQSFVAALPDTQTISKLPAGIYSVGVRAYKVSAGVHMYSSWTQSEDVTVK